MSFRRILIYLVRGRAMAQYAAQHCARRPEIRGPFCKRYDEQAHGGSIQRREVRAIGRRDGLDGVVHARPD